MYHTHTHAYMYVCYACECLYCAHTRPVVVALGNVSMDSCCIRDGCCVVVSRLERPSQLPVAGEVSLEPV